LTEIRHEKGNLPMILVTGQDSANTLQSWHRWKDIFSLANLLIMSRPGDLEVYPSALGRELSERRIGSPRRLLSSAAGSVAKIEVTGLSISSSDIRQKLGSGLSPRFLLPDPVLEYIHQQGLFREKF
jgi:nicotinate-nucleotide adenylyltransferase